MMTPLLRRENKVDIKGEGNYTRVNDNPLPSLLTYHSRQQHPFRSFLLLLNLLI